MAKRLKLDPKTDKPTCLSDIDKNYVIEYTKLHGTPEQRAEIKKVMLENVKEGKSNFNGKPYKDIKMKAVRRVFVKAFFPALDPDERKKGSKTILDKINEL